MSKLLTFYEQIMFFDFLHHCFCFKTVTVFSPCFLAFYRAKCYLFSSGVKHRVSFEYSSTLYKEETHMKKENRNSRGADK